MKALIRKHWFDIHDKPRSTQIELIKEALDLRGHVEKVQIYENQKTLVMNLNMDSYEILDKLKRVQPLAFVLVRFSRKTVENEPKFEVFVRFNDPDEAREIYMTNTISSTSGLYLIHKYGLREE